jgi:hypothetical protein
VGTPRSSLGVSWGMLRRVPLSAAQPLERRRSFEACGETIGFSPWGSTAAFDITIQFRCQDFCFPREPPLPKREGLPAADRD